MADADYVILGSVTVRASPASPPLAPSDQSKLLLARLLVAPGKRVSTDALIDALWGDEPGKQPRNAVQVAISATRRLLGDSGRRRQVIHTDGDGYRLVVEDPLCIDAERFVRLAARGHDLVTSNPRAAHALLGEALDTWGGMPFGDLGDRSWAIGRRHELESGRDRAEVDHNEVLLVLGRHAELEGSLRRQIARDPLDERRRGQLVRVLDASGRAAEAQLAYREAYRELGALGPELRRIGEDVARGAPRIGPAPRSGPLPAISLEGGGSPDGPLLCAVIAARRRGPGPGDRSTVAPGLGMLTLLVDREGGEPHPVGPDMLVSRFGDADSALRAAAAIVAAGSPPARVGVHAGGWVHLRDGLAGSGVARCRQLALAAHPGQVLLSAKARARLRSEPELRNLGEQRFFDLGPGEQIFELVAGAPPGGFPPPATLSRLRHNLPVETTRFIGREDELARLSRLVAGGELVTLTGAGGCGKTRLALQLAAHHAESFPDGVWFAELAELPAGASTERVATAVASQLAVRALPEETQQAALTRHLSDRRALLVLDNCEQVHAASGELAAALRTACRDVCLVATTRRPLRIYGEQTFSVASLPVEDDDRYGLPPAVLLLLERAGLLTGEQPASDETLALATRICRAVDGLPLAIELAAAQVPTRGLHAVAEGVEATIRGERDLTDLGSGDPTRPDRQQTIEAAIDWSYRLLATEEQRVLRRLSVFHGTFAIAEAQAVAEADIASLQALVDCSMVAVAPALQGTARLRLVEPIRAFARLRLVAGDELENALAAHAAVFWSLATEMAPRLFGAQEQDTLQRLEAEHDNLRAALAWYVERRDSHGALRLVGALWWLWFSHGHLEDGCAWVKRALAISEEPTRERVRALRAGSHLSWWRGDHAECDSYNSALHTCALAIGDDWGLAWVKMGFGATAIFRDPVSCLPLFLESKRRFDELGHRWESGYTLHLIGGAYWFGGEPRAASAAFEEAVEIFAQLGHRSVLASLQRCAGLMAARCDSPARGRALCNDALRLSDAIGDRAGSAQALNFLGAISRDEDDLDSLIDRHAEALRLGRAAGDLWATCWALDGLAGAALQRGEGEIAARLLASSTRLAQRSWYMPSPRERELREADLEVLREALGVADFEHATTEGELMGVGEIVACALAFAARHAQ
ncbi:MAG TPA: BTAD domain-containing putative transcriptional regulator [Solirubrobacteraceae bacterium]|nr:BTAD domain-containing putative transcriptional regulator [Solirubrobacteraceae bacterium]